MASESDGSLDATPYIVGGVIGLLVLLLILALLFSMAQSTAGGTGDEGDAVGKGMIQDVGILNSGTGDEVALGEGNTGTEQDAGGPPENQDQADQTTTSTTDAAEQPGVETQDTEQAPDANATTAQTLPSAAQSFAVLPDLGNQPMAGSKSIASGAAGENPFLEASDAKSVVFVIDISGSMDGNSKLGRVMNSLIEAIESLKTDQRFMVILFDSRMQVNPQMRQLSRATPKVKMVAKTWLNGVTSGGGTEPLDAMMHALQQRPERIVILTDGGFDPSYVDQITDANQRKSIRIDAIGLEEVVPMLQELARNNGGVYYQAK